MQLSICTKKDSDMPWPGSQPGIAFKLRRPCTWNSPRSDRYTLQRECLWTNSHSGSWKTRYLCSRQYPCTVAGSLSMWRRPCSPQGAPRESWKKHRTMERIHRKLRGFRGHVNINHVKHRILVRRYTACNAYMQNTNPLQDVKTFSQGCVMSDGFVHVAHHSQKKHQSHCKVIMTARSGMINWTWYVTIGLSLGRPPPCNTGFGPLTWMPHRRQWGGKSDRLGASQK